MRVAKYKAGFLLFIFATSGVGTTSFGDSDVSALPNVTKIGVYDVSDTAQKGTEGTLEASGINETLIIEQGDAREYRFVFRIENDGSDNWEVSSADPMRHEGLNKTWSVSQIYYNYSGQRYGENDGSFSSGTVQWSTASGPVVAPGEKLWAKYVVEIDQNRSSVFDQTFRVNDTVNDTGSLDRHRLVLQKYGRIQMELLEPPQDSVVVQYQNFTLNGSATCLKGKCADVNLTARYNSSSGADTEIPDSGTPFETLEPNSKNCSEYLARQETCYASWQVNASGELESYHKLDVRGSSNSSFVPENDSGDGLVQINTAVIIDLNWTSVDFGTLSPGETSPAVDNKEGYNLTVDTNSEPIDELWIRGTDLVSDLIPDQYSIGVGNITVSDTESISDGSNLTENYRKVESSLSSGSSFTTRYWIDVPEGIYRGDYTGKIFYKANTTR